MQTLVSRFPFAEGEAHAHIFHMIPAAMATMAFHKNAGSITRFFAKDFPVHLVVHEVSAVLAAPADYTQPHVHEHLNEVNIILSHHDLLYAIQVGEERYTVSNNACIWIPKGTVHSANVLKGSGHFISIRFG